MALATAKLFVEEGAYVFITGRRQDKLDEAAASIGSNVTTVQGDASRLADLDRLYETVKREKGKLDILFVSAGGGELVKRWARSQKNTSTKTSGLNTRGALSTVQKALPLHSDGASIILNGSIAPMKGFPTLSVYSGSKAALRAFARSWVAELKDRHIRVNVLSPWTIDTPLIDPYVTEGK